MKKTTHAFTLLEVMFAMALFAVAGIALAQALHQVGLAALDSAEASRRLQLLESRMVEILNARRIQPGEDRQEIEGEIFLLETLVRPARLVDEDGRPLTELYEIEVRAIGPRGEVFDELSTLRYSPRAG